MDIHVKLNGFSIVPSASGISIRPKTPGGLADPEVCLRVKDGKLFVTVYTDTQAGDETCVAAVNYFPVEVLGP
jgi:hypothetical protein